MTSEQKELRVRLNQNPYIDPETKAEIERRKETFGISLGKVLDEAIASTTHNYPTQEDIDHENQS